MEGGGQGEIGEMSRSAGGKACKSESCRED